MHDLTGFERDLLFILAGEDGLKGLTIKDRIREYYGEEIYDGRLYPALDNLVEKGLLQKGERDDRTNEYRLSQRGRHELKFRRKWQENVAEHLFG